MSRNVLYFDRQDHELLAFINKILTKQKNEHASDNAHEDMINVNLHPHGIKTLVLSRQMLVANAMIRLLGSTTDDGSDYRLQALRTLYDEVLHSAKTDFRRNTARVLMEIMKALVRAHGDIQKQLYLASDFRKASQGKPHTIRRMLKDYGLVEMPEDWSQLAFDHHVHDSNTKGRKSPTHLIMDAWIKGIRYLTVIYYNYINKAAAAEVLEAASIIGMDVRIGIEFSLPFGRKHVQFIWSPHFEGNVTKFLEFLDEAPVRHLMELGKRASEWRQKGIYAIFKAWNEEHAYNFAKSIGLEEAIIPLLNIEDFKAFVGSGQASHTHLADFIYRQVSPIAHERRKILLEAAEKLNPHENKEELELLQSQKKILDCLNEEYIYDNYVSRQANFALESELMLREDVCKPDILRFTPLSLLDWLTSLQSSSFITLNIAGLTCEGVLTLLWQCQGLITHLDIFNLRDWNAGRFQDVEKINRLQQALNAGSIPRLKSIVLGLLKARKALPEDMIDNPEFHAKRLEILHEILYNIRLLRNYYSDNNLRTRMGTNATDRVKASSLMGLIFPETLPPQGRKALIKQIDTDVVPYSISLQYNIRYTPELQLNRKSVYQRIINALPFCSNMGYTKEKKWLSYSTTTTYTQESNVRLLHLPKKQASLLPTQKNKHPVGYLNTTLKNILKVILGFIPAAIAFHLTQTWWILAWFGPIIWFGITGVRNIIQAVVAGTGFHRYTLLCWKDHVSWSRLCDSLLYTGISVPLLELFVRIWLLQDTLHMTVTTNPIAVYAIMSVINGLYISWHNVIRGFPKEAIIGNLFRSVLSLPVALFLNELFFDLIFYVLEVPNANIVMQNTSAILSKLSSDTVAAIIEGYADKKNLTRMRRWDYKTKLDDIFTSYVRLDLAFPEEDINAILKNPSLFFERLSGKNQKLRAEAIINALDLMYFWYYRPRSHEVCKYVIEKLNPEERKALGLMQLVLLKERDVSQMFVDGLVGRNFAPALVFYLDNYKAYLKQILHLCALSYAEDEEHSEKDIINATNVDVKAA